MKIEYIPFGFAYFTMGTKRRRLLEAFEKAFNENNMQKITEIIDRLKTDEKAEDIYYWAVLTARESENQEVLKALLEKAPKEMWLYGETGEQLPFREISRYAMATACPANGAPNIYNALRAKAEEKAIHYLNLYFEAGCPTDLRNQIKSTLLLRAVRSKSTKIVQAIIDADKIKNRYFYDHPAYALPAYLESVSNGLDNITGLLEKEFNFGMYYRLNNGVLEKKDTISEISESSSDINKSYDDNRVGPVGSAMVLAGIVTLFMVQCHSSSTEEDEKASKKTSDRVVIERQEIPLTSVQYYKHRED